MLINKRTFICDKKNKKQKGPVVKYGPKWAIMYIPYLSHRYVNSQSHHDYYWILLDVDKRTNYQEERKEILNFDH